MDDDTVNEMQDTVNAALLGSGWDTLNDLVSPDAVITGRLVALQYTSAAA